MLFPSLCIDNFFNNPSKLLDFSTKAEKLTCREHEGNWPGYRSQNLAAINESLFLEISKKILSVFYSVDEIEDIYFNVEMYFQKIEPGQYGSINEGWVHKDDTLASGVVYLNETAEDAGGTSIYTPKILNIRDVTKRYTLIKSEQYLNFNPDREDVYKAALKEHNSNFKEITRFTNVFNRLIMFDGSHYHGVPAFNITSARHTLVFFIHKIGAKRFPVSSTKYFLI